MGINKVCRDDLLKLANEKRIYLEGNILKVISANDGDSEFIEYLNICKNKDKDSRIKRLSVTKQVQKQNKELVAKQKETDSLMIELQNALDLAQKAEEEANKLREIAEKSKDKALEDLDLIQKKSQFKLIGTIVRVALFVILGVGILTTVMYAFAIVSDKETQIIGSTWSNMFGILLTNAFSIVGTIMGVKYASEQAKPEKA